MKVLTIIIKKRLFITLAICTLAFSTLWSQESKNTIPCSTVKKLVAKGNLEIVLFQSDEEDLYIHAPTNISRNIKSEFKDGTYTIVNSNPSSTPAKVILVVQDLNVVKLTGKAKIETPTNVNFSDLSITMADEASATLFISSSELKLNVVGNGNLHLSGDIDTLRIKTDNNSEISLDIKSYKIYASLKSESEIMIEGTVFTLFAEMFNFSTLDNTVSQTGTCIINTFDNSMARIKGDDKLLLQAKDRSSIIYKGTGKAEVTLKDKGAILKPDTKKEKSLATQKN
jgi:hypothetical protein